MKKIINIMTIALGILAFSSCGQKGLAPIERKVKVVESNLAIPAKGGEAKVKLETKGQLKVSVDAAWCTYAINGNEVTFTATENSKLTSRYAKAVFTVEDENATVTIHQYGYFTGDFSPSDITAISDGEVFNFPYKYDEKLVASTDAEWITLSVTEDNLRVDIAENTTKATADNKSRKAEIAWQLGADKGMIKVEQYNVDYMQPDANWTVSYDGYKVYEDDGEKYEHISNEVADPAVSGMYYITYFSKDDFSTSGLNLGNYILSTVPSIKDDVDEVIEYYAESGYELTYSDFLYEDSDFEIFPQFEPGDYYACVVGFDENFSPTGRYAVAQFTKTGGEESGGYEKWLGSWNTTRGSNTDTWVFTEKEKGHTYSVTGIEGETFPVEVIYDSSTEGIEIHAQEKIATVKYNVGECEIKLVGSITSGSFWTGNYTICSGTINGDTATLTPGKTSDGTVYELCQFIAACVDDGKNYRINNDRTSLPTTLTKVGGGGDEPGGHGSENFNKFIGSWEVTPADSEFDPWVTRLVEVTPDAEIAAYDWQGWSQDWVKPATVTYKDSKITFKGGSGVPLAENVIMDDPGDPFTVYYLGSCIIDGVSYVINSEDKMYDACEGSIDKDGNIVLTGLDIELRDGNTYKFAKFGIAAISADGKTIYTYKNEAGEFPVTMKKASGSKSVKAIGNSWNLSLENAVKVEPSHILSMQTEKLVPMEERHAKSEPSRPVKFIVK